MSKSENDIITAWEKCKGPERIAFIEYLKETYGKNLLIALDKEALDV